MRLGHSNNSKHLIYARCNDLGNIGHKLAAINRKVRAGTTYTIL